MFDVAGLLENPETPPVIVGCIVFLIACGRFSRQPPPAPPPSAHSFGLRWMVETAQDLARSGRRGEIQYEPPSRANTSFFNFWLYRLAYAASATSVFALIYAVPALLELVVELPTIFGESGAPNLTNFAPLTAAFYIAGLALPPFRGIEEGVRRQFYELAMIDARLRGEIVRLETADYQGDDMHDGGERKPGEAAELVWRALEVDGFERGDLAYDPNSATAQSMWMKASLLLVHIKAWQANDRYMKSFATLK